MVRITVELVRKRAEHHDCLLAPLEEIALHQENIEKIEYLQDWCPKLKILLMQSNLIAKIENLNKLKYLSYLNLALNNIEVIENLERCESLQKLDLTLNFIGEITSVANLVNNYNLENLYLTGNPCTDYDSYRQFVVATLPQLIWLDGEEIERSYRIKALQNLPIVKPDILFEQENYRHGRRKQKARLEHEIQNKWENQYKHLDEDERNKKFWAEKCEHAPEVRYEIERMKQLKLKNLSTDTENKEEKRTYKMFASDGRPFNINQAKIDFKFDDSEPDRYILDLSVYKHLNTNLLDVDVQPNYVRVTLKGKIFQLCLPEEVDTSNSTAQRSQITGHLVITMPKPETVIKRIKKPAKKNDETHRNQLYDDHKSTDCQSHTDQSVREYLEIGPAPHYVLDFTRMTNNDEHKNMSSYINSLFLGDEKLPSSDFIDDPDVPALV
ncbi:Protein tilB homolog [Eumeta japonica]|uniref:Protein tilB homolog n=1 Tax=Eumeta variegata TaxID=151549 RepID=A0A4C1VJA9_EUMVA|nr:Protein tilB homolog [Eumeta japonica]